MFLSIMHLKVSEQNVFISKNIYLSKWEKYGRIIDYLVLFSEIS